jgi:N utilization substance protein B
MASRRKGRILAFQALYSWEANQVPVTELIDFSWLEPEKQQAMEDGTSEFSRLLFLGTVENISVIDKKIQDHVQNWDFSRLNRVDLAILRLSIYTLIFQTDVSPSIVIDEAIGIAREFGTKDSFRFINGVLDNMRKTLTLESSETQAT